MVMVDDVDDYDDYDDDNAGAAAKTTTKNTLKRRLNCRYHG